MSERLMPERLEEIRKEEAKEAAYADAYGPGAVMHQLASTTAAYRRGFDAGVAWHKSQQKAHDQRVRMDFRERMKAAAYATGSTAAVDGFDRKAVDSLLADMERES